MPKSSPDVEAPRSMEFIREEWPVFAEAVQERLVNGARVYGDSSFDRNLIGMITEIQAELLDVSGWSSIQWARLEGLKSKLELVLRSIGER